MEFVRNIPAHLDKHRGQAELLSLDDASIRNLNTTWGGSITARYYKGIAGDGDNLVIVQSLSDNSPLLTANAEACTAQAELHRQSVPVRMDTQSTTS